MKTLHQIDIPVSPCAPAYTLLLIEAEPQRDCQGPLPPTALVQARMTCGPATIRPGGKILTLAEVRDLELEQPRLRLCNFVGLSAVRDICRLIGEWVAKRDEIGEQDDDGVAPVSDDCES